MSNHERRDPHDECNRAHGATFHGPTFASDLSRLTVEEVQALTAERDRLAERLSASGEAAAKWRAIAMAAKPVLEAAQERGADAAYWREAQAVIALYPGATHAAD